MALPLISLAPARTVALRSSMEPAAACAAPMNFSKFLRTWSTLASATDRISFDISKRSRTSSLMVRSFALAGLGPDTAQTPRRNYADPRVPHCGPRLRKPVIDCGVSRNLDCGNTAIWLTAVYHYPTQPAAKGSSSAESLGRVKVIRG